MDPMVRYPHDPAPLIPGTMLRFRWPRASHNTQRIRDGVQEGGPGLFVLHAPALAGMNNVQVVAECYYPDQIHAGYVKQLDPMRMVDYRMGRLVCLGTLDLRGTTRIGQGHGSFNAFRGELTPWMVREVRRNNRNARADLRRSSSAHARKLELRDALEADEAPVYDAWADAYAHAYVEGGIYGRLPEHGGAAWKHNIRHRRA